MPIYRFKCVSCNHIEEHLMSINESYIDKTECIDCGCDSKKIPSVSSFELKGGGWFDSGYSK